METEFIQFPLQTRNFIWFSHHPNCRLKLYNPLYLRADNKHFDINKIDVGMVEIKLEIMSAVIN